MATINEGVEWTFEVDLTEVERAYKRAQDAGVKAGREAGKAMERALGGFEREASNASAAMRGVSKSAEAAATQTRALADASRKIDVGRKAGAEMADMSKKAGMTRQQLLTLQYTINDMTASLASGASPLTILMQQGGQVTQAFGGVTGTMNTVRSALGGVSMSALGAGAAMAAGAGVAIAATIRWREEQDALERSLNRIGRLSGMTLAGANATIEGAAGRGGISISQAQGLAGRYLDAGADRSALGGGIEVTRDFAKKLGVDFEEAAAGLAQAMADPAKGAEDMAKKYGLLSLAQTRHVQELAAAGNVTGAVTELIRGMKTALDGMRDPTWSFSQAIENAGVRMSNFMTRTGEEFAKSDATINRAITGQRTASMAEVMDRTRRAAAAEQQKRADDAAAAIEAMFKSISPEDASRKALGSQVDAMKRALGTPGVSGVLDKIGVPADKAREALARLQYQFEHFETPIQRIALDAALAAREAMAYTAAERAAVAAEKARVDVLRQSGDVVRAAAAAEAARQQVAAEGARKIADANREADKELALAGLRPYERAMKQIELERIDLREQTAPNIAPLEAGFSKAADASSKLADALLGSAGRISIGGVPAGSVGLPPAVGVGVRAGADPRGMIPYIRETAKKYGIDPDTAVRVARSEGLGNPVGDAGSSYGAYQMHVGGKAKGGNAVAGLGDDFRRETGLDPADPRNERATIDYALRSAAKHGWGAFHGAARVGIGDRQGIGGEAASGAGPSPDTIAAKKVKKENIERIDGAIRAENDELQRQNELLDQQAAAYGKSDAEIARAAEAQKLYSQFQQQGVPVTAALRAEIDKAADSAGRLAERTSAAKAAQEAYNAMGQNITGGVKDLLLEGRKPKDVGLALLKSTAGMSLDALISGSGPLAKLLGMDGKDGAMGGVLGMLGGALGVGGATMQQMQQMQVRAGVVNVNGGIAGGLPVPGSAMGGGMIGTLGGMLGMIGGKGSPGAPMQLPGAMGIPAPASDGEKVAGMVTEGASMAKKAAKAAEAMQEIASKGGVALGGFLSMFDGWFAEGGDIGVGKFGIVGEHGPELIRGPANITPANKIGGGGPARVAVHNYAAGVNVEAYPTKGEVAVMIRGGLMQYDSGAMGRMQDRQNRAP